ncbi:Site-specific recombinase XerD [Malonomonas rubra DSM 5091]|uniref:Site-specific recombinase XerD n=1 Tax=Malonomonas rubra DSM 5091 TaxID=1122189 RepID=A0A1M6HN29_MALRU|nr:site-specific integrase [Malonomonas rubra]SHJ23625.1 Site-specific recombinase XerD [Malonomonas rubra DSM 5091]
MRFTDRSIDLLKPKDERYERWESGRKGFGIRVSPKGRKSWIFLYRFNGKTRRMTFGTYPKVTLAEAHLKHSEAEALLDDGIDPGQIEQEEKDRVRKAPTVEDLAGEYIKKWAKPNKRSWQEDQRMLKKDVIPTLGAKRAADIKKRDVVLLLEDIYDRGAKVHANRMLALVRKMFNFAVQRDIVEFNPCLGIGKLHKEDPKDRCLSKDEIKEFWGGLDKAEGITDPVKLALRLVLVTAQRPGEVLGMHWSEIDGEWWTLPGDRTKNDEVQRVYLSSLALELLGLPGEGFVFPSPRTDWPIKINALAHALKRAQTPEDKGDDPAINTKPFTPHDLRRSAATHIAEMGYSEFLIGKILNHKNKSITAVYNRHQYDNEKKQALEAWGRKLKSIIEKKQPDNVIELRR